MPERKNEATAIRNLQRYLRQLSYDEKTIKAPPIDGVFESDTRDALRSFQALKGLPVTGVADQETWELLYALYRASLAQNSPPSTVAIFPRIPKDYELRLGNADAIVMLLQYMLNELTRDYSDLGELTPSGIYDAATENAVTIFQGHNVLKKNGRVDRRTWNQITDQYNSLFTRYPVE